MVGNNRQEPGPASAANEPAQPAAVAGVAPQSGESAPGLRAFVDEQGRLRAPKPGEAAADKAAVAVEPATATAHTALLDANDPSRGTITITVPAGLMYSTHAQAKPDGGLHVNCAPGCTINHGAVAAPAEAAP